jgi:predicted ATPase/class 3 adenylate cyclase
MADLPTGTVTFLFTDIEGSTRLLQELGPDRYHRLQADHAVTIRAAITEGDGTVIRTEGDSFFAAFPSPAGALRAAVEAQRRLAGGSIRVRMGLHTGEGRAGGDDYVGIDVNRAARIAAAGHGGQVLLSDATRGLVEHVVPGGVRIRDLGEHHLKDIAHPEHLFDLVIEGLAADFPPPTTLDARPNNLPGRLTSFVGRGKEIDETVRLLSDHRLVTLTGPGGTGKTRLALEVAAELLPSFADGAFFVDLAPLADPGQVCPAICEALGVREEPGGDLIDTLVNRLMRKRLLLVLDNFEHLLEEASLVDRVLGRVPEVRVLVTSRTRLGLYGEQEQPVPPLIVPEDGSGPDLEALAGIEAVELFVDRAREALPGFALTAENASAVAEICARLDGLPLAIELAASRIKVLSPDAILSRLRHSLDLLAAGARNIPERQRTLRGAIEWSYGLLDESERRLFARMSVFAGGADLEAADAVANPDGDLGADVFDGLASLVDKSLVRQTETGAGEPRFGMLETIREFARDRSDLEWDGDATRRRHADHFLALAEASEPHLTGTDQVTWLDRLDRDHENLQAALRWAIDAGEAERGMRAAASVWRFCHLRGHVAAGRAWLERLLAFPVGRTAVRAKAEDAAGSLSYWQGDLPETERHYREALGIYRELGDRPGIAQATYNLAFVPLIRGSGFEEGGRLLLHEAIELYQELGDEDGAAKAKGDMGLVLMLKGDYRAALPLLEEFLSLARERGDTFRLADGLLRVSDAHRGLGDHDRARRGYLEALDVTERANTPGGVAAVLQIMASVDSDRGDHQRAMRLFGAGMAIAESIGDTDVTTPFQFADPVGDARKAIGDEATDRALAEGRAMSRDQALAYARSTDD